MKRWLAPLLAITLLAQPALAKSEAQSAKQYVDVVASQVLDILKTNEPRGAKQRQLVSLFNTKVDIPFVAKYVLGRHWRAATPAQQQEYVSAYGPFVLNNYAVRLTKYSGQSYKLREAREDGDSSVVTMEIVDPGKQNVLVDYRLRKDAGAFKLIDISVEGVSLLTTQRSEFNSIVNSKGIDHLIAALKKQGAALASRS